MFSPNLLIFRSLVVSFVFSNVVLSQNSRIIPHTVRIEKLCSEMSTTCARSCQSFIGHCNLNAIIPPTAPEVPQTTLPNSPVPSMIMANAPNGCGTPVQTAEMLRNAYRNVFLERLCTEMSSTCARNCQTFIEQCNIPSSSASESQNGISQVNPPAANNDAPQQQQPTSVPIIIGSSSRPMPPVSSSDQSCTDYKGSCVDHRDCCEFLYCKRFKHESGGEAKLGYCEHDPSKYFNHLKL